MRRLIALLTLLLSGTPAVAASEAPTRALLDADVERRYERLVADAVPGERFGIAVDPAAEDLELAYDAAKGVLRFFYRMNFNQVAEGWSWRPQADPAREDYYRYQFLPLGSRERAQGAPYVQEDLPGRPREVKRIWRYDYFLAFDNPYEFFKRPTLESIEGDVGFAAEIETAAPAARELLVPGRVAMLAWAHWAEPNKAESTTFWKATDGKPVDLTLKNRYLIGRLEEVWFVDAVDGRVLVKLQPEHVCPH